VNDLLNHRWRVIIVLAVSVAVDKHFRLSGGLLQSRLVMAAVFKVLFVGRLLLKRRADQAKRAGDSSE